MSSMKKQGFTTKDQQRQPDTGERNNSIDTKSFSIPPDRDDQTDARGEILEHPGCRQGESCHGRGKAQ